MNLTKITYNDPYSILVVNAIGKIRQVHVPFRVQVVHSTSELFLHSWVIVEQVSSDRQGYLVYKIGSKWYPYHLFYLSVAF